MIDQPYVYQRRELIEPDWRRFPGWADVSPADWESAQWQRAHCVKNARQLRQVLGPAWPRPSSPTWTRTSGPGPPCPCWCRRRC